LRSLVISSIPWSQSNRGIDILTEGLIDCGFEVDHLFFLYIEIIKIIYQIHIMMAN